MAGSAAPSPKRRPARRPLGRAWRRLDLSAAFLPLLALAYLGLVASYMAVWAADPYSLRPWGAPVRLSAHPYVDDVKPLIFSTAARDGTDLVVIGGSTAVGYMPQMLREAFPAAAHPANLAYNAVSAQDMEAQLQALASSRSLKRIVFSLEWPLIKDNPDFGRIAGHPPYDGAWSDPAPEYSVEAARATAHVLLTGVLAGPGWLDQSETMPDTMRGHPPMTSSASDMAAVREALATTRPWVTSGAPLACASMPNLQHVLALLRPLAARGVAVDIVFPPYSLAAYATWSARQWKPGEIVSFKGADVWPAFVSLRRCAVEETAGAPNIRVHAFDTDAAITGDLSLYKDTTHVVSPDVYRQILMHVAKGDAVLTAAQWPAFEATLRAEVQNFTLPPAPAPMPAAPR